MIEQPGERIQRPHLPSMMVWAFFFSLVMAMVAGCQLQLQGEPSATASPSTPVAALIAYQQSLVSTPTIIPDMIIDAADAEALLLENIYDRLAPSVVNIDVTISQSGSQLGLSTEEYASGSGFVYDREGHIVTNSHVVSSAHDIIVTFHDGSISPADVVGFDNYSDLAVIHVGVEADRLFPVSFGDSDAVRVGERAVAIGNPFGLSTSMTVGIVSGLGRQLPSAELISGASPGFENPSIIQVDTDINPGNSGGPLLNSHGEVIGVNTAIRTESGVFQGVGFAVPSSTVQRIIPELIAHGKVDYAWLGISTLPNENGFTVAALATPLELPVRAGVLVERVTPNSPASQAGLRGGTHVVDVRGRETCAGGDIIVAINGSNVSTMDDLTAYLVSRTKPGDTVSLMIVRGGETFDIPVTLASRPDNAGEFLPCNA